MADLFSYGGSFGQESLIDYKYLIKAEIWLEFSDAKHVNRLIRIFSIVITDYSPHILMHIHLCICPYFSLS